MWEMFGDVLHVAAIVSAYFIGKWHAERKQAQR